MTEEQIIALLRNKFGAAKKANANWVRIRCPTCTPRDASKMKRGVNLRTLGTNCFICQKHLNIDQLFGKGVIEDFDVSKTIYVEPPEHAQARQWPCKSLTPLSALDKDHPAIKFLSKDFLYDLKEYEERYKAGYITKEHGVDIVFPNSRINTGDALVFPVFHDGEFVGWQCRFLSGNTRLKYLHVFKKGDHLYNFDEAKKYDLVVVVEGVKKAWKFDNAVATLGKGISEKQIQLLQQNWNNIVIMYDSGEETQKKAKELTEAICKNHKNCINIDPMKYGFPSPDEMTKEQAQAIVYKEWTKAITT